MILCCHEEHLLSVMCWTKVDACDGVNTCVDHSLFAVPVKYLKTNPLKDECCFFSILLPVTSYIASEENHCTTFETNSHQTKVFVNRKARHLKVIGRKMIITKD